MSCFLFSLTRWNVIHASKKGSNLFYRIQMCKLETFKLENHLRKKQYSDGIQSWLKQINSKNAKSYGPLIGCQFCRTLQNKTSSNSKKENQAEILTNEQEIKKLSLVQRYKKMLKEYWYVLIPVHVTSSLVWFGSFYYVAKSGIDIVPYLEAIGLSETLIAPLKNSSLGHIAVASAMYKLATPARYMVTLGGTTFTVKSLTKRGYLKPMPSRLEIKNMIQQRRKGS